MRRYSARMVSFADKPLVTFETPEEWDAFLQNDPPDGGVRLRLAKKTSPVAGLRYPEALDVALCHGWIDGQVARLDDDYVLQAFTPRRRNSPWSKINVGHATRLIEQGRMRPGGQAEIDRAKADGRWDAAYRVAEAEPTAEFVAALAASPKASAFWDTLTKQNRWAIIFRLSQLKRPETVTRRIGEYVAMLERGEKLY